VILSKACEYGVKAVIFIAVNAQDGKKVSLKELTANIESPEAYTSKILQKLVREDIVKSNKGAQGGFEITDNQLSELLLWDVVKTIDGVGIVDNCALGMNKCSTENPCPLHKDYEAVRLEIKKLMKQTTIKNLSKRVKEGESVLKN
jgi:Rrf2 family iron-sulfur cluster assembly transcriptional regulator